jgi:aldehyde dehydrogenase
MFNREIQRELGVANVLTMAREATIQNAELIFQHPDIALICATGGPAVVKAAMKYGKRVIAAGPGNPPVVVDETADLDAAAKAIIQGASFDNNLLCIGEKEVFVVASVADAFLDSMRRAGAFQLDARAIEALTNAAFHLRRRWQGRASAAPETRPHRQRRGGSGPGGRRARAGGHGPAVWRDLPRIMPSSRRNR